MSDYRDVSACRLCNSTELSAVLDLGETPLANELDGTELFPLIVNRCQACGHHQLSIAVAPERLWGIHYPYRSGTSPLFVAHLEKLANEVAKLYPGGTVLELASNDGTLVKLLQARGLDALGMDPSGPDDEENGLHRMSWPEKVQEQQEDCIIALNVLAHVDDLHSFVGAIRKSLKRGGTFIFEVGYLGAIGNKIFDTIYHEHFSYHDLTSLWKFFALHELAIDHFEFNESQGDSLRCYVKHADEAKSEGPEAWSEGFQGLSALNGVISSRGAALREALSKLAKRGEKIAGFGCPAKLTTMMYATGIKDACPWECIFDDNPMKVGRKTPGTGIPIVPTSELLERKPDTLVIFSWNFEREITQRIRAMGFKGGIINPMGA